MDHRSEPPWRRQQTNVRASAPNPRKRPADTQEDAWVADEDRFVLQQAKKKAEIRVKEGRAKPIDWLAVTLRFIDPSRNLFEDEVGDGDLDVVDPEGVFEGLSTEQLAELERDIDVYATLEKNKTNKDFWETMQIICTERLHNARGVGQQGRGVESVSSDVEKLFSTKTFDQLEALETQIKGKLRSNEDIDVDYWEQLLRNLVSWKARAKLRRVSQAIMESQLQGLRNQQDEEAHKVRNKLESALRGAGISTGSDNAVMLRVSSAKLDPEPMLKVRAEDKTIEMQNEAVFLEKIASERRKVLKLGFVPSKRQKTETGTTATAKAPDTSRVNVVRRNDEVSQATTALYDREAARGIGENEEVFAGEEDVTTTVNPQWANKHRPRKPRYFNRVQMGYEWNKYNQTHYDHDNPPPKVVQGYKFNVFYPDLIDKAKAPTYKIEREHGRKRGQTFAPAGEEDTCLIRFIAGPPYEDVAFRIVDKEWDYSAKRERGFRSSFDKGILQLHFQFKKIFYRK